MKTADQVAPDHHLMRFDTFAEYIAHNEEHDYRTPYMDEGRGFYGVDSMQEAIDLARTGLPREGIKALGAAATKVEETERELMIPRFHPFYAVDGADVDVARYLSGEPENMIGYYLDDAPGIRRVATLVVSIAYSAAISTKTITQRGHAIMALLEAIERTGIQTEIWADKTTSDSYDRHGGSPVAYGACTIRQSIRIKAPGELFDPSTFMYVFTHASMLRALGFNTMHSFPKHLHNQFGIPGGGMGYPVTKEYRLEDYPEGAIFIPSIRTAEEPTKVYHDTLRKLGLLTPEGLPA